MAHRAPKQSIDRNDIYPIPSDSIQISRREEKIVERMRRVGKYANAFDAVIVHSFTLSCPSIFLTPQTTFTELSFIIIMYYNEMQMYVYSHILHSYKYLHSNSSLINTIIIADRPTDTHDHNCLRSFINLP